MGGARLSGGGGGEYEKKVFIKNPIRGGGRQEPSPPPLCTPMAPNLTFVIWCGRPEKMK